MQKLKDQLLTILRHVETDIDTFRRVSDKLSTILAQETAILLDSEPHSIQTPITDMVGTKCSEGVVLIPILRSGLAMLPSFQTLFEGARVGILGYRRDKKSIQAIKYYENLPDFADNDRAVIIDPMLATGGTASSAIDLLKSKNIPEEKIIFVGILSSPEGKRHLETLYPKIQIILGAVDENLNHVKYIVPGIGDFGDRYFGTI
jgi:uracil phosphoribosyltransferase